jgi:hypothetical protein
VRQWSRASFRCGRLSVRREAANRVTINWLVSETVRRRGRGGWGADQLRHIAGVRVRVAATPAARVVQTRRRRVAAAAAAAATAAPLGLLNGHLPPQRTTNSDFKTPVETARSDGACRTNKDSVGGELTRPFRDARRL